MRAFSGVVLAVGVLSACGPSRGGSSPRAAAAVAPPVRRGAWAFYGTAQGLSDDVQDVSPDEGGNVYVAGGDAVYVKRPADVGFLRFAPEDAGLTKNCNDYSEFFDETPAKPFYTCRILAVAGAAPGKAIIGFDSFNVEQQIGAKWTLSAGGADVLAFDAAQGKLTRTRHAWIASPPHVICATPPNEGRVSSCPATYDYWWANGRRVFVQVRRIVVNHDRSSLEYGDVWLGGKHATFGAILANAAARGLPDRTAGWGPEWADAKDTWDHLHPAISAPDGTFVNGYGWALAIDPRDGTVWGSNEYKLTHVTGYGADLTNDDWWMGPFLDPWPTPANPWGTGGDDQIHSISFCPDGTLWIGSVSHGLARIDPDGVTSSYVALPASTQDGVSTVACDPTDASVWIGLAHGGILRLEGDGTFAPLDTTGLPAFTTLPVQSIQIDRWSAKRVVYFAFAPNTTWDGKILQGGGVGTYDGP